MRALCATRPAEWWDTGNDGNRLALALCGVCPALDACRRLVPHPAGVIVAGVAYSDAANPLPVCHCGYPHTAYRGGPVWCCPWCGTTTLPAIPRRIYWQVRYRQQREQVAA